MLPSISAQEDSFAQRVEVATEAKARLAEAAVAMVSPRETIFLDSSSTAYFVARKIIDLGLGVTVITNSLPIMDAIASMPDGIFQCAAATALDPAVPWHVVVWRLSRAKSRESFANAPDLDHMRGVLARMFAKATHAIALLDVPDERRQWMLHALAEIGGLDRVKQTVRDMRTELAKTINASATAMANHNRLETEYMKYVRQSEEWFARANQALDAGNEELARKALARHSQWNLQAPCGVSRGRAHWVSSPSDRKDIRT